VLGLVLRRVLHAPGAVALVEFIGGPFDGQTELVHPPVPGGEMPEQLAYVYRQPTIAVLLPVDREEPIAIPANALFYTRIEATDRASDGAEITYYAALHELDWDEEPLQVHDELIFETGSRDMTMEEYAAVLDIGRDLGRSYTEMSALVGDSIREMGEAVAESARAMRPMQFATDIFGNRHRVENDRPLAGTVPPPGSTHLPPESSDRRYFGFDVASAIDNTVPPYTAELRGPDGNVIGTISNIEMTTRLGEAVECTFTLRPDQAAVLSPGDLRGYSIATRRGADEPRREIDNLHLQSIRAEPPVVQAVDLVGGPYLATVPGPTEFRVTAQQAPPPRPVVRDVWRDPRAGNWTVRYADGSLRYVNDEVIEEPNRELLDRTLAEIGLRVGYTAEGFETIEGIEEDPGF